MQRLLSVSFYRASCLHLFLRKGKILGPIEYPQAKDTVCHGAKLVKIGSVILEEKSMWKVYTDK